MLYTLYETQRTLLEPFVGFSEAAARMYENPHSVLGQLPGAQRLAASFSLFNRLGRDYGKPEFDLLKVQIGDQSVVIDERVALSKPFCNLVRFKRFTDDPRTLATLKEQPVVLIVAPLSGHHATLLRDTVRTMLQGHKVYITDWQNARDVPVAEGKFGLDDYVAYVQEFIHWIQARYGNCHVMSVCQPTVPVLAAISLNASRGERTPLSMTMMGGPIDARRAPTSVDDLATRHSLQWFENNLIYSVPRKYAGVGRTVYPGFLQHAGFMGMNPRRHMQSHWDFFQDLIKGDEGSADAHRAFYDEYNAVLDMDSAFYLDTIRVVFQEFRLMNGNWDVRNADGKLERVRPQDIKNSALLTIEGELDDISGSGQTRAAHDLCTGIAADAKQHFVMNGAGHYGIFSGPRWREYVYPRIQAFIKKHNGSAGPRIDLAAEDGDTVSPETAEKSHKRAAAKAA